MLLGTVLSAGERIKVLKLVQMEQEEIAKCVIQMRGKYLSMKGMRHGVCICAC